MEIEVKRVKYCIDCEADRPISEFYNNKGRRCKSCISVRGKRRRAGLPEAGTIGGDVSRLLAAWSR